MYQEPKGLGPDGRPCNRRTVGLLQRRPAVLDNLIYVGKETNRLEEVGLGSSTAWTRSAPNTGIRKRGWCCSC